MKGLVFLLFTSLILGRISEARFACHTPPYNPKASSLLRGGQGDGIALWDGGLVPYEVSGSFTHSDRETFMKAIRSIEEMTCIRFVPRTGEPAYMEAGRSCDCEGECVHPGCIPGQCFGGGWTEGLGKDSPNRLFIGQTCLSPDRREDVAFMMHELFHILGVIHTQTRPDARSNIKILWKNIQDSKNARYQYKRCSLCKTYDTAYSCMSIMYYREYFGPDPNKPTMVAKKSNPGCDLRTSPIELAETDIQLLNKMYKCEAKPTPGKI